MGQFIKYTNMRLNKLFISEIRYLKAKVKFNLENNEHIYFIISNFLNKISLECIFTNFLQQVLLMGSLISNNLKLYVMQWQPPKQQQNYISIITQFDLPSPIDGKILIPISKIACKRDFVMKFHHHIILIEDMVEYQPLIKISLRGLPIIGQYELLKNRQLCQKLQFNHSFCPIPMVLQKFHESYIKNYINSFHFYGINILSFDKIEEYLKSECSNRFLICSNYQLEQLSFKFQRKQGSKQVNTKLTILCFCNKDEYSISKRIQFFLQKESIEVFFFQNILDIIEKINGETLMMPNELILKTQKLLFYLNEKEKQIEYLSKMAKRLQRSIRNTVVEKVHSKTGLISRIQKAPYSIAILSNESKEMKNYFELYEQLQKEGLQDRIIFIRRQNEINDKFTQRVHNVVQNFKYRKVNIFQKEIIFYGCLDIFRLVLKKFPSLKFKRFIDQIKQKDKIKQFLCIQTEVIMTNHKICTCQQIYSDNRIQSTMIYVRFKQSSIKLQRREINLCQRQNWFIEEEELISFYTERSTNQFLSINFNYDNKKISYLGRIMNEFFAKMREKKSILYNKLNDAIFLFSCEYYTLDQMSTYILKYFTSKMLGNYDYDCLFNQIKGILYQQLAFLCRSQRVEWQVLEILESDESKDIYQLSQSLIQILGRFPLFLEELNSIWCLFLYQDRKQHHTNSQILLFLLLLAFNRTNFVKYSNETLQNLTVIIKKNSITYEHQNLTTFRNKNRNNFAYNIDFLSCEVYEEGGTIDSNDILVKIEGNQLTSFKMYMPIWKKNKRIIICPFSKFEINTKEDRNYLLKLSINSQHKLLQKFTQTFLQENNNQLKLINQDREMRKFDVFLDSMAHSKYETAGYILKKIIKEEKMMNQDCLNAFSVLYHLKRNEMETAKQKIRQDKYHEILSRVVKTLQQGQKCTSNGVIPQTFYSNKRIEESNKEYQILQETSNDNESVDHSTMIKTDPQMIKNLTSDYKMLRNTNYTKNRSPSSILKDKTKVKVTNKVPISNKRTKPEFSICDKLSQSSRNSRNSKNSKNSNSRNSRRQNEMNIVILPPVKQCKEGEVGFNSNTFGNKFMTEYSTVNSQNKRTYEVDSYLVPKLKSSKSETGEFVPKLKSSKSQAGDLLQQYDMNESTFHNRGKKLSKFCKQSDWLKRIERTPNESGKNREKEDEKQQKSDLFYSTQNEQTGNFNFQSPKFQKGSQKFSLTEQGSQIIEESAKFNQYSEQYVPSEQLIQQSQQKKQNFRMFPIKKTQFFNFSRNQLTEMNPNITGFDSPLRNIEEQRSSQFSLNSASNILSNPTQKQNFDSIRSSKDKKLFTFFRDGEPIKPRFSIKSKKNSLMLSNISSCLEKIEQRKESSLFYNFEEEGKENELSDMVSISSVEVDEEEVFPEEMIQSMKIE